MKQIAILYKIKLKNKCKFYQSFFSINSIKYCYIFFIIKEILSLVITSIILYFFYNNVDAFGLNELYVLVIIMLIAFVQLLGYNESTHSYILAFLDLYKLSSRYFFDFFKQTVAAHCIAELCFKLSTLLPIIVFSYLWMPQSVFAIILGLLIGLSFRINQVVHSLTKDIKNRLDPIVSTLKYLFSLFIIGIVFTIFFQISKTALYIAKILMTSSTYNETALLNQLLKSLIDSINWFKTFFKNYSLFFIFYFFILITLSSINNFKKYQDFWESKNNFSNPFPLNIISLAKVNQKSLPFLKILYKLRINVLFVQLIKQPEIIILLIIESVILFNIKSNLSKFIFILWFYFIGNSNYIRSLFVVGNKAFNNYSDCVDLYYWRLIDKSILELYKEKLNLLLIYTNKITWCQSIFACILSTIFLTNKLLIFVSCFIIIFLRKYMHIFNCKLASFSSFFTFANACKSTLRAPNSDESKLIEDKLQNILKLPFTLIPMVIIVLDYIYSFLSVFLSLTIIFLFFVLAYQIKVQIEQYIRKAVNILEKANVPD